MPFKHAKSFLLDLGETDKQVFGDLKVEAASSQDAQNILGVMQMAVGFARIGAANDPRLQGLAGFASELKFSSDERFVTVSFRFAGDKLGAALRGFVKHVDEDASGGKTEKTRHDARDKD